MNWQEVLETVQHHRGGIDWYRVISAKVNQLVRINIRNIPEKDLLPGVSRHFDKIGDVDVVDKTQAKETGLENKHQHDGRYRAKPGCRLYCHDKDDDVVFGFDQQDREFTFHYHDTDGDGIDWYRVVSSHKDCLVRVDTELLPPSGWVDRIPDQAAPIKDYHRFDGTYRVQPGAEFHWNGKNPLGGFCQVIVKPEGLFTFQYCFTKANGDHVLEVRGDDRVVIGDWCDDIAALVPHVLAPDRVQKISSSTNLEDKMSDHYPETRCNFDGTYRVKPGGRFEWHGQGDTADVGPGEYFTFRHVADSDYEIKTADTTVVGRYFNIDTITREDDGNRRWLRPSNVEKISNSTRWDVRTALPNGVMKVETPATSVPAGLTAVEQTLRDLGIPWVKNGTKGVLAQCFKGHDTTAYSMSVNTKGAYYCFGCGVKGHSLDELSTAIKAHRATTSASAQKDDTMDTNNIKQAFSTTNLKAVAAVKTGAEQAGAHVAHEIVIAQVEKLLGARFPAEFYGTEIGRAVISMGSAYALMLTTQVVQHPLATKANHVATLALTAATYESAGPLMAKAKEFVEGTVMAAMNAGVDLGSK